MEFSRMVARGAVRARKLFLDVALSTFLGLGAPFGHSRASGGAFALSRCV